MGQLKPVTQAGAMNLVLSTLLLVNLVLGQSTFRCPEPNGTFEDAVQCDKYYECYDGVAEERLCQDGLVFDPFSRKREPCDHYFNVDCGTRRELQPPQGKTDFCPRLNGFYAHPDPGVCHIFFALWTAWQRNTLVPAGCGLTSTRGSATGRRSQTGRSVRQELTLWIQPAVSNAPRRHH